MTIAFYRIKTGKSSKKTNDIRWPYIHLQTKKAEGKQQTDKSYFFNYFATCPEKKDSS